MPGKRRENGTEKKTRKTLFFALKIVFAVSIISFLIYNRQEKFFEALKGINYLWLIPPLLLYLIHLIAGALRWYLLLKVQNINISFMEAFSLTMQAFFFSLVIPGGAIGGDVAKIGFIASRAPEGKKFEGSFSVLIDRFTGMMGLFSVAAVVIIPAVPMLTKMKSVMETAVAALAILCVTGLCAGIFLFFHREFEKIKFIARLIAIADKITKGTYSRMSTAFETYRNSIKTLIACIALSVVFVHLNMVLTVYFIAMALGVSDVSPLTFLNAVTIGNTAGLLPISISGVGARDAVIEAVLSAGGCPVGDALAIPIIYTALIILYNFSGGIFFIIDSRQKGKRKKELAEKNGQ